MKELLLLLVLFPCCIFAQDQFSAPLPGQLIVRNAVSPSGKMVSLRYEGIVYTAPGVNALWNNTSRLGSEEFDNNNYNTVDYVTNDVIIVSGLIFGEEASHDFILRSADAGKTWHRVNFGRQSQIDETWFDAKGRGWMSGSSEVIYYTANFGESWKELKLPEKECRISSLHFMPDGKTGIIGSLDGKLFRTGDNCTSWTELPTPLSQNKYKDIYNSDRPGLSKMRIIGNCNFYIVSQQGRTFFSNTGNIDWQRLKGVCDFEVTEDDNLYLIYNDGTVELRNSSMLLQWTAPQKLSLTPHQVRVRNNVLYVFDTNKVCRIHPGKTEQALMLTNDTPIPDPERTLISGGRKIGISGNNIFLFDESLQKWYRYGEAPFYAENAVLKDDKLLIYSLYGKSFYSYDVGTNTFHDEKLKLFFDTARNPVKNIMFEMGSHGCFHSTRDSLVYNLMGSQFVAQYQSHTKKNLKSFPKKISTDEVNHLIALVNEAQERLPSVADYNFTPSDIDDFVSFIAAKKKNGPNDHLLFDDPFELPANADVAFYITAAKNVNSIANETIEAMMAEFPRSFSTTVNWVKATFVFQDGTSFSLYDDTRKPNYLRTPYTIMSDNLLIKCHSVKVAEALNSLTNRQFCPTSYNTKRHALFAIADFMFRDAAEKD